ncbi:MAG: hypothetical protein ACOCQ4_01820 [bacterium]
MFKKFRSKKKWEELLQTKNESTIFFVKNFMIPDKIDFEKFDKNSQILRQGSNPLSKLSIMENEQHIIRGASPSIYYFKESHDRPFGFPAWFLAAYPDICFWFSQNSDIIENIEHFKPYAKNEQKLIKNGRFTSEFLREAINYYKRKVHKRLECQ